MLPTNWLFSFLNVCPVPCPNLCTFYPSTCSKGWRMGKKWSKQPHDQDSKAAFTTSQHVAWTWCLTFLCLGFLNSLFLKGWGFNDWTLSYSLKCSINICCHYYNTHIIYSIPFCITTCAKNYIVFLIITFIS
jgi:hypothetical protein